MRQRHRLFWAAEIILGLAAAILLFVLFTKESAQHRVAVIVSDADAGEWERFIAGIKQGAYENDIQIVITGTDVMTTAQEEQKLIAQEIAGGVDALIVQPVPEENAVEILDAAVDGRPLILVQDEPAENIGDETFIGTDNAAMGTQLAAMILQDYGGNLKGRTIGIVSGTYGTTTEEDVYQTFCDGIEDSGASIAWTRRVPTSEMNLLEMFERQERVDIVVAIDNRSLEIAGMASGTSLQGAVVYGIGKSQQALYALDRGNAAGLVIPNDYDMGYLAIEEIAARLEHPLHRMSGHTTQSAVYRAEDLFLPQNADFLYIGAN